MMSLEHFEQVANRLFDRVPSRLLHGLHGGIIISEESEQRDPDLPDVFVLGEYVEDPYGLGCYIVIYYGSFKAVFSESEPHVWEEELWETMVHEIRHHVEAQAGVDDLDLEDLRDMEAFRRRQESPNDS